MEQIYLDWAATAPLCEEAVEAMRPYLEPGLGNLAFGGNANSLHGSGRAAFKALEEARAQIAKCVGARRPNEIIFTSGATEADNAALHGIVRACAAEMRQRGKKGFVPHFVTTSFEHDAVLATAHALEADGCEVSYVEPTREGFIEPEALRAALRPNTVLVSVMAANNEVGTVQPIAELARTAHEGGALFHTDMVQLLGKQPIDLERSGVDAASFSAHKVCGPKGVGALYLRNRTPFAPFLLGGGQEEGRRSGTQNVCGAVGFAAACAAACKSVEQESVRQRALRDRLYRELTARAGVSASVSIPEGSVDHLPTIVNVLVDGLESETLILRLDLSGVCVSGGSACSSHSLKPSHVLTALGIDQDRALCSLRISLGRYTTEADVERFLEAFDHALAWE